MEIDISFDVYTDTPVGKDPDIFSPTLRRYHKTLWSKRLPNGRSFMLSDELPRTYLHHRSDLGEFWLSSDSIGHTYSKIKVLAHILDAFVPQDIEQFFKTCSTIGAYIVFPSNRIDRKMTINGARGCHYLIRDRFDLTLECIRRFYLGNPSPLSKVLDRYKDFFDLFDTFQGYIDFFVLQDLVSEDYLTINFFLPFDDFQAHPLPADIEAYAKYKTNVMDFVNGRNIRLVAT